MSQPISCPAKRPRVAATPSRCYLRIIFVRVVAAFLLLVPACAFGKTVPPKDRIVVLITIDGFPAWIWRDPMLPVPTFRKLAKEGAQAGAMTVSNPSITWINHTTLVTGVEPRKHGVLFNGLLVRGGPGAAPKIEQWRDKADLVRVPTLYDLASQAGLKTAQVNWVAILNSRTIDYEMLEIPRPDGAIEREVVDRGFLDRRDIETFTARNKTVVWRDQAWTRGAAHIVKEHKPNLLLFHLLNTDACEHRYGPDSWASYTAFAYADRLVGDLLAAIDEAGFKDKATVVITTDHGFKKVSRAIYLNAALLEAGLLKAEKQSMLVSEPGAPETAKQTKVTREVITSADACVMPEGGLAFAYVTDPAKKAELLPKLTELFSKIEGVDKVLDGHEGPRFGMPTPEENQGMGDLILHAKPGYTFQKDALVEQVVAPSKDYLGTHGYFASDPELDGMFVAWGYGIKPGVTITRVSNLDVAPTLAELLGVKFEHTDGHVMREILREDATLPGKTNER
jgi:predicted AlkP superfamily pyrophosphatase or phosphodiesterase